MHKFNNKHIIKKKIFFIFRDDVVPRYFVYYKYIFFLALGPRARARHAFHIAGLQITIK